MNIFDELDAALADVKKEAAKVQNEVAALRRERDGEVWYWQGDGGDKLESLTCPVLIEAEDLRAILARTARFKKAIQELEAEQCYGFPSLWEALSEGDKKQ